MYALKCNWSAPKFLDVAQVRATGDLYHKLEGMAVALGGTVETIYRHILELIQPKANLYQSLYACQRDGRRSDESMEAPASRVRVIMKSYSDSTESTFGPTYKVDVFFNMIRDKVLSMRLHEVAPKTLYDAVSFASKWMQDYKNTQDVSSPQPSTSFCKIIA